MALVREPEVGGNVRDLALGAAQHRLRAFDPGPKQVAHGTLARSQPELAGEMEAAYSGHSPKLLESNACADAVFHIGTDLLESAARQSALDTQAHGAGFAESVQQPRS